MQASLRLSSVRSLFFCLLLLLSGAAHAATLIVGPGQPYTAIQSAINAANPGDTVLVAPGTYYENIDFKGKAITVTSSAGPATTIIDGGFNGPAVTFKTAEPRSAILSNFTIQHGGTYPSYLLSNPVPYQGSLVVTSSSPTILNNVIANSHCWGIQALGAAPLIQGNNISTTLDPGVCSFGGGAAIYIGGNLGVYPGGSTGAFALILSNTIENNVQSGNEDAGGNGGAAVAVWGGTPVIQNNIMRNNASPGGSGGAINVWYGTATIVQNLIYGNSAGCGGGAIAFQNSLSEPGFSVLVANNTMVNNVGTATAGDSECISISQLYPSPASYGASSPSAVFVSNIISGSTTSPAIDCSWFDAPSEAIQPIFDHNLLNNAGGKFFGSFCIEVSAKYGNITADPQFIDPVNFNFHLKPTSPAIDSGNNSVLQSLAQLDGSSLTLDYDANPRVSDFTGKGYPIVDMGIYENQGVADGSATTIVLTSSSYSGNAGLNYTLTANVVSALGTPTGTLTFFMDNNQIGAATIGTRGIATLSNFLMTPGVHSIYVTYPGQGAFTPARSVIIIVGINLYSSSLSLTSSSNPSITGQPVTFTVTASSPDGSVPSPIILNDSSTNTPLATLTPNSAGVATFTTSALALGGHALNATYSGDSTHASATGYLYQNVTNGYPTTATLTCTPTTYTLTGAGYLALTVTSSNGVPTGSISITDNGATFLNSTPLFNGNTGDIYASQVLGTHTLVATFTPTGNYAPSTATCTLLITLRPITVALASSVSPSSVGQSTTFTATITYGGPSQTFSGPGSVTFSDGANALQTVAVSPTANPVVFTASYTSSSLAAGIHTITATANPPTTSFSAGSASASQTVNSLPANATLTASSTSVQAGAPVTLTAQITPTSPTPTGSVTFLNGSTVLGTQTLANSAASITLTTLPNGTDQVTCTYSGDSNYSTAACKPLAVTVSATPTTLTLTSSANPVTGGATSINFIATLTSPSGPVANQTLQLTWQLAGGAPVVIPIITGPNGVAAYAVPGATFPVGSTVVSVNYAATGTYAASTLSLNQVVNAATATLGLTVSPNPAYNGEGVTINTTISSFYAAKPGHISLLDGGVAVNTILVVDFTGIIHFAFKPGIHVLSLSFTGDLYTLPATSGTVTLTILPNDFTLTSTPAAISVQTGHHLTFALKYAPLGLFDDQLLLSAPGLPPHVTLQFMPNSVPIVDYTPTATSSVYLDTDDVIGYLSSNQPFSSFRSAAEESAVFLLPWLALLARRRRPRLPTLLACVLASAFFTTAIGCSGKYPASTAPGTYTLQITATGATTGTTHTLSIPFTVSE